MLLRGATAKRMINSFPVTALRQTDPFPPDPNTTDHFVYLHDVSWDLYEALLAVRGESSVPRMTYLEGELELMSPSKYHEWDKKRFARLLEAWAEESGVMLEGIGSWTLKNRRKKRGTEPDECYTVGRIAKSEDDRPDIAIEVIWTSGGIDKLEVYRKLGVREVWFYERGSLRFFELKGDRYAEIPHTVVLPTVDVDLLLRFMHESESQTEAVRGLRAAMRERNR
jgi:Uma2 family endonuclease